MTPLHGRSDDVTDYSKLTLTGGTALYCTITRYAYTAARTACIRGKIDTIRESMPGNSNSPQVPRRGPRMPPGTRRYQLRYPTVFVLTRGRLHTCIDRCNSQHAPGPPPPVLAYAMTPLHVRSDDVTDYSKLTLTGGTALYCTITRYAYTYARTACIRGK